jgi:hypothetical protein
MSTIAKGATLRVPVEADLVFKSCRRMSAAWRVGADILVELVVLLEQVAFKVLI